MPHPETVSGPDMSWPPVRRLELPYEDVRALAYDIGVSKALAHQLRDHAEHGPSDAATLIALAEQLETLTRRAELRVGLGGGQ